MLAKVKSYTIEGLKGLAVDIETDVGNGLPAYETVGLPDTAVKESRQRGRAAIKHSGFTYPPKRITINLAPADSKKEGSLFDLAIAVGILAASEQLPYRSYKDIVFIGELSLDGTHIRHNGRHAFSHERLARARGAYHQYIMSARDGYLDCASCDVLD